MAAAKKVAGTTYWIGTTATSGVGDASGGRASSVTVHPAAASAIAARTSSPPASANEATARTGASTAPVSAAGESPASTRTTAASAAPASATTGESPSATAAPPQTTPIAGITNQDRTGPESGTAWRCASFRGLQVGVAVAAPVYLGHASVYPVIEVSDANQAALGLARAYLSRFLTVYAQRRRQRPGSQFGPTSEEVTIALGGHLPLDHDPVKDNEVAAAMATLKQAIAATPEPLLARLVRVFRLSETDLAIVCVLLAPELDHELERAYAFALDDFTRKRGDIGFIARVIAAGDAPAIDRVLLRFDDTAPLRRLGVVTVGHMADAPATMRPARLADRIVGFLRGHDTVDELVHGLVRIGELAPHRTSVVMNPELVQRIARALDDPGDPPRVLLAGELRHVLR